MNKKGLIKRLKQNFDEHANTIDGVEVWFARDLQKLLGYEKWQMFERAIARAETACEESGNDPADHFTIVSKPAETGKGAQIEIKDVLLKAKITPEELPPAEDIKKVGRRVKKDEKKLTKKQHGKSK